MITSWLLPAGSRPLTQDEAVKLTPNTSVLVFDGYCAKPLPGTVIGWTRDTLHKRKTVVVQFVTRHSKHLTQCRINHHSGKGFIGREEFTGCLVVPETTNQPDADTRDTERLRSAP